MVDFLLQDNVTETLVKFITQNGHSGPRPGPNDEQDENMKLAYRYYNILIFCLLIFQYELFVFYLLKGCVITFA